MSSHIIGLSQIALDMIIIALVVTITRTLVKEDTRTHINPTDLGTK